MNQHPHLIVTAHVHACVARALEALRHGDTARLCHAFDALVVDIPEPARALVSRALVESFLAPSLRTDQAGRIFDAMQESRLCKYAAPLMLAYQAHLENKEDRIAELAPELVRATEIMYGRLKNSPYAEALQWIAAHTRTAHETGIRELVEAMRNDDSANLPFALGACTHDPDAEITLIALNCAIEYATAGKNEAMRGLALEVVRDESARLARVPAAVRPASPPRDSATSALRAIKARVNGAWDDPDLAAFGALNINPEIDILNIVNMALNPLHATLTGNPAAFSNSSIRDYADFREDLERLSAPGLGKQQAKLIRKSIYETIDARVLNYSARASASTLGLLTELYDHNWLDYDTSEEPTLGAVKERARALVEASRAAQPNRS